MTFHLLGVFSVDRSAATDGAVDALVESRGPTRGLVWDRILIGSRHRREHGVRRALFGGQRPSVLAGDVQLVPV